MTAFYIWLGVAFLLFILEILITSTFALLCFAVGCVIAAFAGLIGLDIVWQIIIFAISSLLSFLFIRPFLLKHLNARSATRPKTNVDALIGRTAKVVERIEGNPTAGRVIIDGDNWQAVSADGSMIDVGEHVIVEGIDSIILTVRKA